MPDTMPTMDALTAWTAVLAVGTCAAAGIAAIAAHQSFNSAKEANAAAGSLAAIERDRRHDELAPIFDLQFTKADGDRALLKVTLSGGRLDSLDEVTLTILDDQDHWANGLPDGVNQDEAKAFVWGPYKFDTSLRYAPPVVSSRQSLPRPLSRLSAENWELLPLIRTEPPRWLPSYGGGRWRKDYADEPIRLLITCRRKGDEPWMLQKDVDTKEEIRPEQRKQASEIRVEPRTYDGAQAGVLPDNAAVPVHMLVVTNASDRPIRNVSAAIDVKGHVGLLANIVRMLGPPSAAPGAADGLLTPAAALVGGLELLQAGDRAAFLWSRISAATDPKAKFTVRFDDDAEISWEIGPDLRLTDIRDRTKW